MNAIMLIGRILFALMPTWYGLNHFTKLEAMTGYATFKKVPAAKASVALAGFLLAAGGVSVILGVYADLGALVLAIVLFVIAFKMHNFWTQSDAQTKQAEMASFFKNISMVGGALFIFAIAATANSDYGWTLTDSLWQITK